MRTIAEMMDNRTLFLVDDEELVRKALSRILRVLGCRVCAFGTAREALEKIEELRPDVIVSDNSMPVMTGLELLRCVRTTHADIRTVIITGASVGPDLRSAVASGVIDRVLTKPWKDSELRGVIRELITTSKATQ